MTRHDLLHIEKLLRTAKVQPNRELTQMWVEQALGEIARLLHPPKTTSSASVDRPLHTS